MTKIRYACEGEICFGLIRGLLVIGVASAQVFGQIWHRSRVFEFLCRSWNKSLPGELDELPKISSCLTFGQNNTLVSTDNKGMAAYLYEGMGPIFSLHIVTNILLL